MIMVSATLTRLAAKARLVFLGLLLAVVWSPLLSLAPVEYSRSSLSFPDPLETNDYLIDASLDVATHTVSGKETVEYVNTAEVSLQEVHFHLWPNAFLGIAVTSVTDGEGRPLTFIVYNDTNMRISLAEALTPGSRAQLSMEFSVRVPRLAGRFGYRNGSGGLVYSLANWFPIASVYEDGRWNTSPYTFAGESFYAESASFRVSLTVPREHVVAATGQLVRREPSGEGMVTWEWRAGAVRDFYFASSPAYHVVSEVVEGVNVSSYFFEGHEERGAQALDVATHQIGILGRLLKPYPYPTLSIVESYESHGGMEYPNVVLLTSYVYDPNPEWDEAFASLVAHEVGHQWFAYMVGSDPYREPWLDEAFARYSELLYVEYRYGESRFSYALDELRGSFYDGYASSDEIINRTMAHWETYAANYFGIVYFKGMLVVHMLRSTVGNQTFFEALREYFDRFLYRNARIRDLIQVFDEVAGYPLGWFFDEWLNRPGVPAYEMGSPVVDPLDGGYRISLTITQKGDPRRMRVPLRIYTATGERSFVVWVNASEETLEFLVEEPPEFITLDPDDTILRTPQGPITGEFFLDQDSDGLSDAEEVRLGTDPTNPDTDGDGVDDGSEVSKGTDPLDAERDWILYGSILVVLVTVPALLILLRRRRRSADSQALV